MAGMIKIQQKPISMKKAICTLLVLTAGFSAHTLKSQDVIFLHHSVGNNVYEDGKVAEWIDAYNSESGRSINLSERDYPDTPWPWNNYPYDWWKLWVDGSCNSADPDIECLNTLAEDYDLIIFKQCYPGASILANSETPDVTSDVKTVDNYKEQYRALRGVFDSYPDTRFMVWTLTPLHRLSTNTDRANRAHEFVEWVKNEWLSEDGQAHPNIYVFDFFGLIAEPDPSPEYGAQYRLKYIFERSHSESDSHPNDSANAYVGPHFAIAITEVFYPEGTVLVSEITVSAAGGVTGIDVPGGTLQLAASVLPEEAENKAVSWSLENGTGSATISPDGLVTAVADGEVTARASATDGSGISGSLVLTISGQQPAILVTDILVEAEGGLNEIATPGGTLQLVASISPENASNPAVSWSMENGSGEATISATGLVQAISDGQATARATATDGSGTEGSLVLTFSNQQQPVGIHEDSRFNEKLIVTDGRLAVRFDETAAYNEVVVYDLPGRRVLHAPITGNDFSMGIANLQTGIYQVVLSGGNHRWTGRFFHGN